MKTWFALLALVVTTALEVEAQSNSAPVRLALIVGDPSAMTAADMLTVELSKRQGLQLLERAEIDRVYREQGLSAANMDYLKLGQVLGADGLLLLERFQEGTNQFLTSRLVAVKPGVALEDNRFPWPISDPAGWALGLAKYYAPLFPKLTVLAKDAVPISVLNLHSALPTSGEKTLERELTLLLIQRLTQERELFVLERQHMRDVMFEQELKRGDESPFWTGRYLFDGTLDKDGFDRERVAVSARLMSPQSGVPVSIEVTGPREDPAAVVEMLTAKVMAALHRSVAANQWRSAQEGDQFFDEAQWAYHWKLWREAQAASESAWALGKRTKDVATLRISSYKEDASTFTFNVPQFGFDNMPFPTPTGLKAITRAMELFCDNTRLIITNAASPDPAWSGLGVESLSVSSATLASAFKIAEARSGYEPQLAELRSLTRQTLALVGPKVNLDGLKWEDGGLWFEKPEDALPMYRRLLESGFRPNVSPQQPRDERWAVFRDGNLPRIVGWSWEDRKRVPGLLKQFAVDCRSSTNQDLQLEGLYLTLALTPFDSSGRLVAVEGELCEQLWAQRQSLYSGRLDASVIGRMDVTLRHKYGMYLAYLDREPFASFRQCLREDYLANTKSFGNGIFQKLFCPMIGNTFIVNDILQTYSQSDKEKLIPKLKEFKERLNLPRAEASQVDMLSGFFGGRYYSDGVWRAGPSGPAAGTQAQAPRQDAATAPRDVVQFTDWGLKPPGTRPDPQPDVEFSILRRGRVWFKVHFVWLGVPERPTIFVAFDPQTSEQEAIPFPQTFGYPDYESHQEDKGGQTRFEVTEDSLFVSANDRLHRYRFREKRWETIQIPMEGGAGIGELNGRLYLVTLDNSILELDPDSQAVQVLASARRRPPASPFDGLDRLWVGCSIFAGPNGSVGVSFQNRQFAFSPVTRTWTELEPSPPATKELSAGRESTTLEFSRGGLATVVRTEPEFRDRLRVPIQLEKDGQPFDLADTRAGPVFKSYAGFPLWFDSPRGLVVVARNLAGHWLIPKTLLETRLEELRKRIRGGSKASNTPGPQENASGGAARTTNSVKPANP